MQIMLNGKTAIVTGASRGIGKAIALELAERGADVIVNYHGAKEAAEAVVKEIKDKGGAAESYGCDVSGYSACEEFIRRVAEKYGAVDILVNNAGITRDNLLMKMTEEDFSAVIDTNLKGTFYTMRFVSRQMLKQ